MTMIVMIMIVTSPKYLEYFTCWLSYRHGTEPAKSSSTMSKWSYGRLSNGFWLKQENKSSERFCRLYYFKKFWTLL
jgi:hypothetical protein